jgi:hypothetical protein
VYPLDTARRNSSLSAGSSIHSNDVRSTQGRSIDVLLLRLPRLLALSLTLSSRFAHDPSPDQIATAFLSMEDELTTEMAGWAADVGVLIGSGVGKEIDRLRRSSSHVSGGRSMSASPSHHARNSLPLPAASGPAEFHTASSRVDGVALQALADSTSLMPRMGRAHSYTAMQRPVPVQFTPQVASSSSFGSSISNFMGFGNTSRTRMDSMTGRDRQNSMGESSHLRSHSTTSTSPNKPNNVNNAAPAKKRIRPEQDRSSFSDVIMAPVQRVARYRILFSTLVWKLDESPVTAHRDSDVSLSRAGTSGSHATSGTATGTAESFITERHSLVRAALEASERVLQAVDAAQAYNLSGLRLQGTQKGKGRSKSRLRVKSRSWVQDKDKDKEKEKGGGVKKADSTGSGSSKGSDIAPSAVAHDSAPGHAHPHTSAHSAFSSKGQTMEAGIDAAYKRHRTRLGAGGSGSGKRSKELKPAQGVKEESADDRSVIKERKRRKSKAKQVQANTSTGDGMTEEIPRSPVRTNDAAQDEAGQKRKESLLGESRSWRNSTHSIAG